MRFEKSNRGSRSSALLIDTAVAAGNLLGALRSERGAASGDDRLGHGKRGGIAEGISRHIRPR